MKKTALLIACAGLLIAGLSLAAPQNASAGIGISFGSRGNGHWNSNHYGHDNYGYRSRGYDRGYNGYGGYGFGNSWSGRSNRGHYDYHPTTIVPHGNHFHVQPGHYDFHRGGHGYNHHNH